jgi:ParB family chromosome partitioning protein
MSEAKLITSVTELELSRIKITDDRLRPVDPIAVEVIALSISERGSLINPLTVRRMPKGEFELVDGGHRLAAMLSLGHTSARVTCYEGRASQIRLLEIDANLARADLSDLDRSLHLAARRQEYLNEYPETAQGNAGASARWDATADLPLHSFVALTAQQTGLNERKIRRYIEAGAAIDKVIAEQLRSAPARVTLNDLLAFAKATPEERPAAVAAFASGEVNKIAKAIKSGRVVHINSAPVDLAHKRLIEAWSRAPKEARVRFLAAFEDDVRALLPDQDSIDSGPSEVLAFRSGRDTK